ncbi:MAG: type II toxin-antitoxin system RelE/ParE family toxin [Candidatus Andersenbacteria bacterium]|nr:type II toxin-antitoxin system RelE/ParE family toxin [Candidatus Andersenbacteria bacterium]
MDIRFWKHASGKSDVRLFLEKQPREAQERFFWLFEQIDSRGLAQHLQSRVVEKIKPHKALFYIRYIKNKCSYRFFFTKDAVNTYHILHGFMKKTRGIPPKELKKAEKRYKTIYFK